MRGLLAVLFLGLTLSGCLGADDETPAPALDPLADALWLWDSYLVDLAKDPDTATMPEIADAGLEDRPRVVVAVVDTGVNPFHTFFHQPDALAPGTVPVAAVDATTGLAARYVPIRPVDDFEDDAMWLGDALQGETLYRFAGTDLFFYSTSDEVEAADYAGHGTATAATVLNNAPDAHVVMVQTTGENLTKAVEWAAAQPWIDVVSVSWGCTANCISNQPSYQVNGNPPNAEASRKVWAAGKLYVNSAGNDPTPHTFDGMDGPPWAIAVGGADPYRHGEAVLAAKLPDVVSNFTVVAPDHDGIETFHTASGTSFAAPTVAGTLAEAIYRLRVATTHNGGILAGRLAADWTNTDVRNALNMSAVYWDPTDYDATAEHPDYIGSGVPVAPGAPWVQMGWGFADMAIVPTMVAALVDREMPAKDEAAQYFMATHQKAREEIWK